MAGKSEPIATQLQAGHKNLTALGDTCLRLFSINGTGRLRLRPSAKAQRKSPAEAGRIAGLCSARRDNCQATSTTLLIMIAAVVATAVGSPVLSARVSMVVVNLM